MSLPQQLKLLMWKNFVIRRRQKLRVIVEILWPLSLFVLLMLVRSKGLYLRIHQCHFEDKPLPSAGQFLFWQGLVCSFNNTCHVNKSEAERNYSNVRSSDLSLLLNDAEAFTKMAMNKQEKRFTKLLAEIETLADDLRNGSIPRASNDSTKNLTSASGLSWGDTIKKEYDNRMIEIANVTSYMHENLEKLMVMHKKIDVRLVELEPYIEITSLLKRININYENITGIVKEVPEVNDIFVRLHNFMCGNTSKITIGMLLESRPEADNFRRYLNSIRDAPSTIEYQYDPEASNECNAIYKQLETSTHLKFLWRYLKPFVRGKIVYAPNSTVIKRVMSRIRRYTASPKVSNFTNEQKYLKIEPDVYKSALKNLKFILDLYKSQNDTDGILSTVLVNAFIPSIQKAHDFLISYQEQIHEFSSERLIAIRKQLSEVLKCYTSITIEHFATEEEAETRSMALSEKNELLAQITFENSKDDVLDPFVRYKIRMNSDRMSYSPLFSLNNGPNYRPFEDLKLITYGFVYLQDMVEKSIINEHTNRSDTPGFVMKQLPHPCFVEDWFLSSLGGMFPMFMVLSWVYTASMIIKSIVYEKEQKLRETMRVLGMNNGIHWFSWFLDSIIPMVITVFVLSTVLVFGGVVANAEYTLVVLFLLCYAVATITMCFLVSVFFSKANLAASSGGIIFFVTYLPFPLIDAWFPHVPPVAKEFGSLLSNVALGMGSKYFALRELEGTGAKWNNAAFSPLPGDSFNMIKIMGIFLVDAFIYFVLAWYIENVFPGAYGIPKSWYFPLTLSYWFPALSRHDPDTLSEKESVQHDTDTTEAEPVHLEKGVSIKNLTKVYKNGKVAIKDLSLNFYQDQITAFLGTNGAGKTTTISILTGLFTPTSGTAEIYGLNVRTQMSYIRQSLGICPQYNILFPELTVQEHLWFFARLKGHSAGGVQVEVQTLLSDLGLYHKRKAFAKHLSGGMKRKLSIAIAFIGGSRTVVLDEPTAGVDPYSRMGIWNLLLKYKKGRTIILTTHNMAEADLLGDRIAIVDAGRLVCCGSNGFLKSRFGWGYVLTVDCNLEYRSNESMAIISKQLITGIEEIIPEVKVIEKFGTEIKFNLPKISGNIQLYQTLFEFLLNNKETLGISSFGFSDTSLEEIFLKLTSDHEEMSDLNKEESVYSVEEKKFEKIFKSDYAGQGKPTHLLRQFKALIVKRFWRSRRNKFELMMQLLLPAILVCFCMSITRNLVVIDQPQPLDVDISTCSSSTPEETPQACTSFYQYVPNHSNWSMRYIDVIRGKTGFGVSCVEPFTLRNRSILKQCGNSTTRPEVKPKYTHTTEECSCITGKFVCDFNTSLGRPEFLITSAGHGFYNLTGRDVEEWILSTFDTIDNYFENHETKRTGGFTFGLKLLMKGKNISTQFDIQNFTKNTLSPNRLKSKEFDEAINRIQVPTDIGKMLQLTSQGVLNTSLASNLSREYLESLNRLNGIGSVLSSGNITNSSLRNIFPQGLNESLKIKSCNLTSTLETCILPEDDKKNVIIEENHETEFSDFPETCPTQKLDPNHNPNVVDNIKIWFNNKWPLSPVVYLNGINNVILRASMPNNVSDHYGIKLTMQGMNLTMKQMQTTVSQKTATGLLHSICIMFSLSFVPASFTIYLIEERVTGCKHLQLLSGVNWAIYWLHAYCWDLVCHTLSALICLITLLCFQEEAYVGADSLPCLSLLILLYGWSSIPMMYPATFFFKVTSSAFVALASFNISIGVLTTTTTYVLRLFEDEYLRVIKNALSNIFLIFPHFCLGDGLMKLAESYFLTTSLAAFDVKIKVNLLAWNYLGKNLVFMIAEGIIFLVGVLCYERFQRSMGACSEQLMSLEPPTNLDEDVESERKRILDLRGENDVLVMKCLTKVYKPQKYVAVNQLCLGVDKGQCFGLIGLNGAGKTSTFKMLTGDTSITFGDATVLGHSVRDNLNSVRSRIGYCPQFDALDSKLTPTEHLKLYASLRNIPAKNIPDAVESCLKSFDLWRYRDVCTRHLSGGNRRKLSTAMAILGDPQLIFLDEPTCGMDPKARRFLWSRIKDCVVRGRAVVLTSHSMSECEALCSRLSIMVNGQFMCLGSIQHLKNKYGKGYNLIIRAPLQRIAQVKKLVSEKIPEGIEKSEHYTQVKYHVNIETFSLFNVLTVLEEAREEGMILDYSLSQKSLGEVFLHFVSNQAQGKQPEGMSRCDCFRLLCCPGKLMTASHISSSEELRMPSNY